MAKRILIAVAALAVALGAYLLLRGRTDRPTAPAAAPPPEVGVVVVHPAEVAYPVEYAGRVVGLRDVEVRALVGGVLLRRGFDEGARVTQGQFLFQIDPAPYEVALRRGEAQLAQAQAAARQAEENDARVAELFGRGVATEKQREDALAARDQARASVQLGEAEVASAKLNLGYTRIAAPAGGVTALTSPAVGTLVAAQQTVLTTITPLDPAYVTFAFTDAEGRAFRELNARRAKPIDEHDLALDLRFGDASAYPHAGRIDGAAQRVDAQTGTIQARAIFPNPDGALLPGQFVRVRVRGITLPHAIVIAKQAVSQGPQGPSVYVVGANDLAEVRPIRLGPELAQGFVVREGLSEGDRVIVDGVIRVRPGGAVRPVAHEQPAAGAAR